MLPRQHAKSQRHRDVELLWWEEMDQNPSWTKSSHEAGRLLKCSIIPSMSAPLCRNRRRKYDMKQRKTMSFGNEADPVEQPPIEVERCSRPVSQCSVRSGVFCNAMPRVVPTCCWQPENNQELCLTSKAAHNTLMSDLRALVLCCTPHCARAGHSRRVCGACVCTPLFL